MTPDRSKQNAIARVEANNADFVDAAFLIISELAQSREEISALDVWARYQGPAPRCSRAMGAAFMRARNYGLIAATHKFIKSGRSSDHNQLLRVWRSQAKTSHKIPPRAMAEAGNNETFLPGISG